MLHKIAMLKTQVLDEIAMKLAWLLPRKVIYWATIRLGAHATQGQYSNQVVPELRFFEAIERW
ncbi:MULTISPECIES: hypothetical protein [unclassified Bradyrhizobium]|uniref:hypothetical protein n=1 Tax=unclassified Bradyrhizobium TaxID=2631580 RepID=UPI002915C6F8|nr:MULTISPECIES: hypothetical protein [unclassified Bradyrhizobium]